MKQTLAILSEKIVDLPFSDGLKKILAREQLLCLHDILAVPVKDWMKYKGFNYHFLKEITEYVQGNGLGRLLKQ